jgi:hypothetical protein
MNDVVTVLTGARDMVREGWIQGMGRFVDGDGTVRRCAGQALMDAFINSLPGSNSLRELACGCGQMHRSVPEEQTAVYNTANAAVIAVVRRRTERLGAWRADSIPSWNDTPGRTQAEVIALFDEAIADVENNRVEQVPGAEMTVTIPAPDQAGVLIGV